MNLKQTLLSISAVLLAGVPLSQALAQGQVGPAGRPGGLDYTAYCGTGKLVGLRVFTGWYVDSVRMICDDGAGGVSFEGSRFGGGGGGGRTLQCDDGFLVRGIHGRDGHYVDRIGITCVHENDPSISYTIGSVGGSGGAPFSFSCPSGSYASGIFGSSGRLVDELGLHCKENSAERGCNAWGDDCGANQYCQLTAAEQCGDSWTEGVCASVKVLCPGVQEPVCGCDGNTYSNRCYAQAAGQNVWQDGEC